MQHRTQCWLNFEFKNCHQSGQKPPQLALFMCKTIKLTQFIFYLSKCHKIVITCFASDRLPRKCGSNVVISENQHSVERNGTRCLTKIIERTMHALPSRSANFRLQPPDISKCWNLKLESSAFIITDCSETLILATVSIQTPIIIQSLQAGMRCFYKHSKALTMSFKAIKGKLPNTKMKVKQCTPEVTTIPPHIPVLDLV